MDEREKLEMYKTPYGIDAMDALDKKAKEDIEQIQGDLDKLYFACFSTPAGKIVLQHLKASTLDQPTWWATGRGEADVHLAFTREGQNSIVREIVNRINKINPKKRETNDRKPNK